MCSTVNGNGVEKKRPFEEKKTHAMNPGQYTKRKSTLCETQNEHSSEKKHSRKIRKQSTSNEKGAQFRHLFYAHISNDMICKANERDREATRKKNKNLYENLFRFKI